MKIIKLACKSALAAVRNENNFVHKATYKPQQEDKQLAVSDEAIFL